MKKIDIIFISTYIIVDFVLIILAILISYWLRVSDLVKDQYSVEFDIAFSDVVNLSILGAIGIVGVMMIGGLYRVDTFSKIVDESILIIKAISVACAIVIIASFFHIISFDSRFMVFGGWIFAMVFILTSRIILRLIRIKLAELYGIDRVNILIIGEKQKSKYIRSELKCKYGNKVSILGELPDLELGLVSKVHFLKQINTIIVVNPQQYQSIEKLINFCEQNSIQFSYTPDLFDSLLADMDFDLMNGVAIVSIRPTSLSGWSVIAKRIFDITSSIILLAIMVVPFFIIGFLIKWNSRGPVFISTTRVSQYREFRLYKFRSMIQDAHLFKQYLLEYNERGDGPLFKMKDDPRVTKIGKILRKTRIDELPQLLNVLKGDMSLVGPRPHEPAEIGSYKDSHRKVFVVKPGITGFSQVSGAQNLSFEDEIRLDRFYIEHWSFKLDIIILLKTFLIFITRHDGV